MRGPGWWAALLAVLWSFGSSLAQAQQLQPVPQLRARVTDLTGTLDAAQQGRLDARLAEIERRKGSQVVVLIVSSTQPEAIEQYAIRVAETWKIGRGQVAGRRVDDGVILLVAKNDRKVRIEIGYGLEGAIPDALAKRIISEAISPRFRQGDFFGGLDAAVADLARLIEGEALPEPWQGQKTSPSPSSDDDEVGWLGLIVIVLVGGLIATAVLGRFLGSMAGGIGAGIAGTSMGLALAPAVMLGTGAFLFLMVFAAAGGGLRGTGRRRAGPVVILPGGGWGGKGGWGDGGGGGFSGGGGGFGGGGASGDW